jgi:peptidoglycan hydrolase-like protein with peptidoglycan-binding domain
MQAKDTPLATEEDAMATSKPIFGVDISVFPGFDTMRWLRHNADIRVTCLYLAPAPFHADASWMNSREQLAREGWGFIPTYLGEQEYVKTPDKKKLPNPRLSAAKGASDGANASDLMVSAGFATGSVVYLDLEYGDAPSGAYQAYVLAWLAAVKARNYIPAIYCPGGVLDWARRYARIVWLAAPENLDSQGNVVSETLDPAQLPGPAANRGSIATQFLFEVLFAGLPGSPKFDLSASLVADPSDYASVDDALHRIDRATNVAIVDWVEQTARIAMAKLSELVGKDAAASDTSPTSDPHCGTLTNAPDRIMSKDKVALDIAESDLTERFAEDAMDVGPTEDDFADIEVAAATAVPVDNFPDVQWPDKDHEAPDYHHLAESAVLPLRLGQAVPINFEITPADIELVLAANRMDPVGFDDMMVLAIRGARLGRLEDAHPPLDVEDSASIFLTDGRPDHKNFRCLIGFYKRAANPADRSITLFVGSTVPNAKYVNSWNLYANSKTKKGMGNLMPTGCYIYRVGTHNSPHAGAIKPALRLTDSYNLHANGSATVIRTKNNQAYDVADVWCKTVPGNNVHCSFQVETVPGWGAPFSSAGCLTVRGRQTPTDQWAKAQKILNKITMDKRCDLILLTGRELAIASALRHSGDAGKPSVAQRELGRLRPGSQGDEVARLQRKLGLDPTGYFGSVLKKALVDEQAKRGIAIDGIFSPVVDVAWGWGVFAESENT